MREVKDELVQGTQVAVAQYQRSVDEAQAADETAREEASWAGTESRVWVWVAGGIRAADYQHL